MTIRHLTISENVLESFCKQWNVKELAVFGSFIRDDFGPAEIDPFDGLQFLQIDCRERIVERVGRERRQSVR